MSMLRVVIADDEPLARLRLRRLLSDMPEIEVVAECASGIEVMQLLPDCPCDLLFLDIQMPGADGFQALENVVVRPRAVVFVTAYAEHAVRAFDVQAVDYLLKPISAPRLQQAIERARTALSGNMSAVAPPVASRRLALPIGRRTQMVELDELDCAIAQANYIELKVGARSFVLRDTISGFHARLDPQRFLRIHRSAIVRIDAIREVEPLASGRYRVNLHSGLRLICGRSYRDALRAALGLVLELPSLACATA
ncbi:MAG: LytTR family DNA-binding domain-containing protein [Thermomonas sp.]